MKKAKYTRIGKQLRNLVMRSEYTYMIDPTHCCYFNERYTFERVTPEEIQEQIQSLTKTLDYWRKPWFYRLFHK